MGSTPSSISIAHNLLSTIEQPLKIPFIAAIILVSSPQKPEIAETILKKAGGTIQEQFDRGAWREVKLLLRLLSCLQGLLADDGVFPILDELFSRAVDLQTASSEDVRSNFQFVEDID